MTTLKATDDFVLCTTNGAAAVLLFSPVKIPEHIVTVKNGPSNAGTTTITTAAGTIDGLSSITVIGANAYVTLQAWGGHYRIISSSSPTVGTLGAGVVHSDASGNLTSSAVTDADIVNGSIAVAKLTGDGAKILAGVSGTPTWLTAGGDWDGAITATKVRGLTGTGGTTVEMHGTAITWDSSGPGLEIGGVTAKSLRLAVHTSNAYFELFDYGVSKSIGTFNWNGGSPFWQFGADGVTCQLLANQSGQVLNLIGYVGAGLYATQVTFGDKDTTEWGKFISTGFEVRKRFVTGTDGTSGDAGHFDVVLNGSGSELPTTATSGFVHIPIMNGPPTGNIQDYAGCFGIVYDYANNKLWINIGGTNWKYFQGL